MTETTVAKTINKVPSGDVCVPVCAHAERRFSSYEDVDKWLDECFAPKGEDFYRHGIHKLPERWEKHTTSNGAYTLVKAHFIIAPNLTFF